MEHEIKKMGSEIERIRHAAEAQLRLTDNTIASGDRINEIISDINLELRGPFKELLFGIDEGIREISDRLELQTVELQEIKQLIANPLDTQAKELRKRGEIAYVNGWIDEAETDLLEAVKKNYQDFVAHKILGNIYYYYKNDYSRALEYYLKAAKYAIPQSAWYASYALVDSAMVYFKLGQSSNAYESSKKALSLLSEDPNVIFTHSIYASRTRNINEAVECLRKSTLKDSKFLAVAYVDDRFSDIKHEIIKLAEDLRNNEKKRLIHIIEQIETAKKEVNYWGIVNEFNELDKTLAYLRKLDSANSYFDLLKATRMAQDTLEKNISDWVSIASGLINERKKIYSELLSEKSKNRDIPIFMGGCLMSVIYFITFWVVLLIFGSFSHFFHEYLENISFKAGLSTMLIFALILGWASIGLRKSIKLTNLNNKMINENNVIQKYEQLISNLRSIQNGVVYESLPPEKNDMVLPKRKNKLKLLVASVAFICIVAIFAIYFINQSKNPASKEQAKTKSTTKTTTDLTKKAPIKNKVVSTGITLAPGERIYVKRFRMDLPPPKWGVKYENGSWKWIKWEDNSPERWLRNTDHDSVNLYLELSKNLQMSDLLIWKASN